MFIAQIRFEISEKDKTENQSETVDDFLYTLFFEGRIVGKEFIVARQDETFISFVSIPEKEALKSLKKQKSLKADFQKLIEAGISEPTFEVLGKETEYAELCDCRNSSAYVLFTHSLSKHSPIDCFDCGKTVPLYRIKQTKPQQLRYALSWQEEYKACDLLQMHCGFGERFGNKQMSQLDSGLTKSGLEICAEVKNLTGKNCYYYLYRYNGISEKKELERKCPNCGGDWLLEKPFRKIFDFRCDRCHLLSNIAFSLR